MAGHAENAFRRKYHGSRTHSIAPGVADATGRIIIRYLHIVNRTNSVCNRQPAPVNNRARLISDGFHTLEMAGPATDGAVQVMGYFFVMRLMALAAITRELVSMTVRCSPGVTNQAIDIPVRRCSVLCHINQGK